MPRIESESFIGTNKETLEDPIISDQELPSRPEIIKDWLQAQTNEEEEKEGLWSTRLSQPQ